MIQLKLTDIAWLVIDFSLPRLSNFNFIPMLTSRKFRIWRRRNFCMRTSSVYFQPWMQHDPLVSVVAVDYRVFAIKLLSVRVEIHGISIFAFNFHVALSFTLNDSMSDDLASNDNRRNMFTIMSTMFEFWCVKVRHLSSGIACISFNSPRITISPCQIDAAVSLAMHRLLPCKFHFYSTQCCRAVQ